MFKKKCQSFDSIPFPRRYRKFKKSDHLHYYPNYHFHLPAHQQKHLNLNKTKNVVNKQHLSASQSTCDNKIAGNLNNQFHNVQHSSSSNSATQWRLNDDELLSSTNNKILKHDSDLSIHSSSSNHSNLSSISVNSSNFYNLTAATTNTSGLQTSSYSSSVPVNNQHHLNQQHHQSGLYYPQSRLDKYRHIFNRSNCTNNTSHLSNDYVDCSANSNLNNNHHFLINNGNNFSNHQQPTPPPLPRYSSYCSISSQPFSRSNLTTPYAGSLNLTASQISLEFNNWYNQLQIHQEEQQKVLARKKSIREWVKEQPLSILQLDSADREVLKIADKHKKLNLKNDKQLITTTTTTHLNNQNELLNEKIKLINSIDNKTSELNENNQLNKQVADKIDKTWSIKNELELELINNLDKQNNSKLNKQLLIKQNNNSNELNSKSNSTNYNQIKSLNIENNLNNFIFDGQFKNDETNKKIILNPFLNKLQFNCDNEQHTNYFNYNNIANNQLNLSSLIFKSTNQIYSTIVNSNNQLETNYLSIDKNVRSNSLETLILNNLNNKRKLNSNLKQLNENQLRLNDNLNQKSINHGQSCGWNLIELPNKKMKLIYNSKTNYQPFPFELRKKYWNSLNSTVQKLKFDKNNDHIKLDDHIENNNNNNEYLNNDSCLDNKNNFKTNDNLNTTTLIDYEINLNKKDYKINHEIQLDYENKLENLQNEINNKEIDLDEYKNNLNHNQKIVEIKNDLNNDHIIINEKESDQQVKINNNNNSNNKQSKKSGIKKRKRKSSLKDIQEKNDQLIINDDQFKIDKTIKFDKLTSPIKLNYATNMFELINLDESCFEIDFKIKKYKLNKKNIKFVKNKFNNQTSIYINQPNIRFKFESNYLNQSQKSSFDSSNKDIPNQLNISTDRLEFDSNQFIDNSISNKYSDTITKSDIINNVKLFKTSQKMVSDYLFKTSDHNLLSDQTNKEQNASSEKLTELGLVNNNLIDDDADSNLSVLNYLNELENDENLNKLSLLLNDKQLEKTNLIGDNSKSDTKYNLNEINGLNNNSFNESNNIDLNKFKIPNELLNESELDKNLIKEKSNKLELMYSQNNSNELLIKSNDEDKINKFDKPNDKILGLKISNELITKSQEYIDKAKISSHRLNKETNRQLKLNFAQTEKLDGETPSDINDFSPLKYKTTNLEPVTHSNELCGKILVKKSPTIYYINKESYLENQNIKQTNDQVNDQINFNETIKKEGNKFDYNLINSKFMVDNLSIKALEAKSDQEKVDMLQLSESNDNLTIKSNCNKNNSNFESKDSKDKDKNHKLNKLLNSKLNLMNESQLIDNSKNDIQQSNHLISNLKQSIDNLTINELIPQSNLVHDLELITYKIDDNELPLKDNRILKLNQLSEICLKNNIKKNSNLNTIDKELDHNIIQKTNLITNESISESKKADDGEIKISTVDCNLINKKLNENLNQNANLVIKKSELNIFENSLNKSNSDLITKYKINKKNSLEESITKIQDSNSLADQFDYVKNKNDLIFKKENNDEVDNLIDDFSNHNEELNDYLNIISVQNNETEELNNEIDKIYNLNKNELNNLIKIKASIEKLNNLSNQNNDLILDNDSSLNISTDLLKSELIRTEFNYCLSNETSNLESDVSDAELKKLKTKDDDFKFVNDNLLNDTNSTITENTIESEYCFSLDSLDKLDLKFEDNKLNEIDNQSSDYDEENQFKILNDQLKQAKNSKQVLSIESDKSSTTSTYEQILNESTNSTNAIDLDHLTNSDFEFDLDEFKFDELINQQNVLNQALDDIVDDNQIDDDDDDNDDDDDDITILADDNQSITLNCLDNKLDDIGNSKIKEKAEEIDKDNNYLSNLTSNDLDIDQNSVFYKQTLLENIIEEEELEYEEMVQKEIDTEDDESLTNFNFQTIDCVLNTESTINNDNHYNDQNDENIKKILKIEQSIDELISTLLDSESGLADPSLQQYEWSLYSEKDERDVIQKKTFTKWVNKHLIKSWRFAKAYICSHGCCSFEADNCCCSKDHRGVEDLFIDLRDGHNLLTLLEVLSGEHLLREKGTMRVHMLQNVQFALDFLKKQRIKLVNIRPEDIVDGNPKLTLGLIWTIILHYQISDIIQHEENELPKEILLKWAQMTTDSYPNVLIRDFTNSWRDGLGFLAIIHRNAPQLIDFRKCLNKPARENLELAFEIYEKKFNICRLLDPEDVDTHKPDEKSLITYVSSIYELFKEIPAHNPFKDIDLNALKLLDEYNKNAIELLKWVKNKTIKLNDLTWRNHQDIILDELDKDLKEFYDETIPECLQKKLNLKELNKQLIKYGLEKEIDKKLNQQSIEEEWTNMMNAYNLRKTAVDEDLEYFQSLANKIVNESEKCHLNLEQIKIKIDEQSERIDNLSRQDNEINFQKIRQELDEEEDRISNLNYNLEPLNQIHYRHLNELDKKIKQLEKLYKQLLNQYQIKLIDKLELVELYKAENLKRQEIYELENQKFQQQLEEQQKQKALTEEELIATNEYFESLDEFLNEIKNQQLQIDNDKLSINLNKLTKQLDKLTEDKFKFKNNLIKLKEFQNSKQHINKVNQLTYSNLLNKLERELNNLNDKLDLKIKHSKQLIKFIEDAESELKWLNNYEDIEINRDWSLIKQLDLDQLDNYHRNLVNELNNREDQFTSVIDMGERLIEQNKHESSEEIQELINRMHLQWSFTLQLTNALETHLKHLDLAQKFSQQFEECKNKFDLIDDQLKTIDCKQSENSIEEGEKQLNKAHKIKQDIHHTAQFIKDLVIKSKKVVPFKGRRQPLSKPIKVSAACMIKQQQHTIEQGEQCLLLDNSTKTKWIIRTSKQQELTVPGCCFILNPPDKDVIESIDKLKQRCEQLSNQWAIKENKLKENMILTTLNLIKSSWDYETYTKMDPEQRNSILSALEEDIDKFTKNKPKNLLIANNNEDEIDYTNGENYGEDCTDLVKEMNQLKIRFSEYDQRIENELNAKTKQDESLENYLELTDQIMADLTEKKNILVQRASDQIPRDAEMFEQLILDHKIFQNEYDKLLPRIEDANQLFNQMDKSIRSFEIQSKHNALSMLHSKTIEINDLYTQRLHELGNIFSNLDECVEITSALEIKFALLDELPADELQLNRLLDNQLKEIEQKLKHNQLQFDNLQLNISNLKQIIEKTRPKQQSNHLDLFRLEEDIKSLNRRWDSLNDNLIKFKNLIEHYTNLLMNYRNKMDHERAWLSQMASQITTSLNENDNELLNTIYDDLLKRENNLQELNVLSARLIHEAQNYDQNLKLYRDDLEDVHPSLDANLSSKSHQTISGIDQIATEMESLQLEYHNLCDTIISHLNLIEEENRRINEEADELEELQMEIAVKEITNLCENFQKITGWLNTLEQIYDQPLQKSSRLMDVLQNQIDEQKQVLNEIEQQRYNLNHLQEKANELNAYSQSEDDQLLPNNIIPNALKDLDNINEKVLNRIEQLKASIKESQDFHESLNELRNWLKENEDQLNKSVPISNDSAKIKEMLLKHKQFMRKLNAKQAIYDVVMKIGRSLKDKSPKEEVTIIQNMLNDLKNEWTRVCNESVDRQRSLEESLLIAGQFKEALQAIFDWLEKAKDSFHDDRVYGDRDTVLHLIEGHHLFQEELKNRSKNLNQIRKFCNQLIQAANGDQNQISDIPSQMEQLELKYEDVCKLSDAKEYDLADALEHAEKLQKSMTELFSWLNEVDDRLRYTDQLLSDDEETTKQQIQEHIKFIAKLNEQEQNKEKSINLAKETLAKCHPDASSVINHWILTIEQLYNEVTTHAKQRESKLNEHLKKLGEMFKLLDELHDWLNESEQQLITETEDYMPDEIEVLEKLIDKHDQFIDQMSNKQKDIERIARTFAVKKPLQSNLSSNQSINSQTLISDVKRKSGGTSFTAQFNSPTNNHKNHRSSSSSFKQEEIRNPKAKNVIDKWRSVWLLSIEYKRRLKDQIDHCREMEKMKTFEFDEWRARFLNWLKSRKARVLDFFKQMDTDNDGKLTKQQFIDGFLKSKFTTSRMEMEYVTPIFDRNHDGIIGQKEYLDTLRSERDLPKTENEIIQNEVHAQVAKCTCPHKYKVFQVEEGKYSFGESQKLCLVRILRSTVMVRVGGGWSSLEQFLKRFDSCRTKGRTNVELREQFILANGISQGMSPFISKKAANNANNSLSGSMKGSFNDLVPQLSSTGPITKIREKTERSVPMRFRDKYYSSRSNSNLHDNSSNVSLNGHSNGHQNNCLKIDQHSDGSFTETDSGTKSRPTSRTNGSRTPNSKAPSRTSSDLSSESLEKDKFINKSNNKTHSANKYLVTPTGMKRTLSHNSTSSTKERWK